MAGAALDVYDSEPLAADDPLLQMDDVPAAAHCGHHGRRNSAGAVFAYA